MFLHRPSLGAQILQISPEPVQPLLAGAEPPLERAVAAYRPATAALAQPLVVTFTFMAAPAAAFTRALVTVMMPLAATCSMSMTGTTRTMFATATLITMVVMR